MVQTSSLYQAATSHPYFPILYLCSFSWLDAPLFKTALSSLGKCRNKNAGFVHCVKKKGLWLLVPELKMSSRPCNKSHRAVMCLLITVRCLTVIHARLYSPGPLHPRPQTTPLLLLYLTFPHCPSNLLWVHVTLFVTQKGWFGLQYMMYACWHTL